MHLSHIFQSRMGKCFLRIIDASRRDILLGVFGLSMDLR